MKSRYKFYDIEGALYFVTDTIVENIPTFINEKYFNILIDNLKFYQTNQGLKIYFYVIMDSHMHMIVSHPSDISKVIRNFKSYTATRIIKQLERDKRNDVLTWLEDYKKKYKKQSKHQVWQEGSHPQLIQSLEMLKQKVDYIHFNPVKRGFVEEPEEWRYSSIMNTLNMDSVLDIIEIEF